MRTIEAAGGVVIRYDRGVCSVLLIHRRGLWDLPKGKRESGESIQVCALREVEEETGASPLQLLDSLDTTRHTYQEGSETIEKITHWFLMEHSGDPHALQPQHEEQIDGVAWVSPDEAKQRVGYENLRLVLNRFQKKRCSR